MAEMFGPAYSRSYDEVYQRKDYDAECDLVERAFARYTATPVHSILDLGCGTGGHSLPLARRGYDVVGVDRSPAMLEVARQKAESEGLHVSFVEGDIVAAPVEGPFDAVLMMFAVLGYQLSDAALLSALSSARRCVSADGLVVFDIWYGPCVLRQGPSDRLTVLEEGTRTLIRGSSGRLHADQQICEVTIQLWQLDGERLTSRTCEVHPMRYFFRRELELLLSASSLRLTHLSAFPTLDVAADDTTWNVLVVAEPCS